MERICHVLTLAALGVLCAASAHAQMQRYDPAIPKGVQEQRVEPSGELAKPAPAPIPPRLVQNQRRAQRDADARHCLTLATNKAVHRCSLKYRSRATKRAAVVKAKAKPASEKAAAIELSKPADVVKPGAPRPGDAAKAAEIVKPMDVTKSGGPSKPPASTAKAPEPAKAAPSGVPTPVTTPGAPIKK